MGGLVADEQPWIDWNWVDNNLDDIQFRAIQHINLTVLALALGFVIAMAMAAIAVRWRWTLGPLAGICGVFYAVPSLALFGMLVPITGLGVVPAEIALVSYTLLILLRNMVAGFDGVPPAVREAADGMGYEPWRRALRVDLPLAVPAIIAGLRIASVSTVALVTVTAFVSEGGFGFFIQEGLSRTFTTEIVVGLLGAVLLAIAFDVFFVVVERFATPWARVARGERHA